jgi:uncharacterized membrane protein
VNVIYGVVEWLHVLAAIVALGANTTYGIWISRSARDPQHLAFALRTIRWLNLRLALPLYGVILITGIALVFVSGNPQMGQQLWLVASVVLYLVALALTALVYTPTLNRQMVAAETSGPDAADYKVAAAQGRQLGAITAVIFVVIVYLMVAKPGIV